MPSYDDVVAAYPSLRQSYLSSFDDCALSLKFALLYGQGWSTHPQARGTLFHRFAAEALRTMREQGERRIPVAEALEILYEVLLQRDVPPEDIVRLPLRELPMLRIAVVKWASENEFNIDRIVAIERKLEAAVEYPSPDGEVRTRVLSGTLDLLVANPPDGASVVDWKMTFGLPPQPEDPDLAGPSHVSYHGYFQQRMYGWLVMRNYPAVQRVTLREVYPMKGEIRRATVLRSDLEHIEREMQMLAALLDGALVAGFDSPLWAPSPGKHCGFCLKPGDCPIEREARGSGAITSPEQAEKYAAEMLVAERVRGHRREALKAYADVTGEAIELKSAKGRMVIGFRPNSTGRGQQFRPYVPDASDRGPAPLEGEPNLETALREAAARAEEQAVEAGPKRASTRRRKVA